MKQVMLQILPLVLHIVVGREIPASEHFSRSVDVTVVEGDGGGGGERRTKRGEEKADQTTHSLTLDNQNCSVNL